MSLHSRLRGGQEWRITLILTFSPQGRRDLNAYVGTTGASPSSWPSPLKGEGTCPLLTSAHEPYAYDGQGYDDDDGSDEDGYQRAGAPAGRRFVRWRRRWGWRGGCFCHRRRCGRGRRRRRLCRRRCGWRRGCRGRRRRGRGRGKRHDARLARVRRQRRPCVVSEQQLDLHQTRRPQVRIRERQRRLPFAIEMERYRQIEVGERRRPRDQARRSAVEYAVSLTGTGMGDSQSPTRTVNVPSCTGSPLSSAVP